MTPRYPGARWLPSGADQGGNGGPVAMSWHGAITKGDMNAIAGWVSSANACHGFVERRGACAQYKDFDRVAYGVGSGNQRGVVTWETWDDLSPATASYDDVNRGSWTGEQCERIADIIAWADHDLGIPIQRMHSTRSAGHGPHGTGISARASLRGISVYEGPDAWSSDSHKPCPGDLRIIQLYGPNLDGGEGSILWRAGVISSAVATGRCGWLPQGAVDLRSALARTGSPANWWGGWFHAAS
jgi:hypothetical protein